jgi:hypothetical protein
VQRGDLLCQLQEHFEDNEHFSKDQLKKPRSHPDNFYPAGGLPEDAVLVIRTDELANFQRRLALAQGKKQAEIEKLPPRAEATYLTIIGAMLELMLGKSDGGRAHSIYSSQAAIIEALIAHNPNAPGIAKSTLEGKFAEARRHLRSM